MVEIAEKVEIYYTDMEILQLIIKVMFRQSLQFINPNWISKGLLGEGNILIFNNGNQRGYSSVDEITPPLNNQGLYDLLDNGTYGPTNLTWSHDGGTNNFLGHSQVVLNDYITDIHLYQLDRHEEYLK